MDTLLLFTAKTLRIAILGLFIWLNFSGVALAQDSGEAEAHRTAINAFYPVMIEHVNAGRLNEARTLCQQAIAWDPQNPVHRYNLACIESKAGNNDKAITALSQATARGYNDPNALRTDPDLAGVRADARFAGIVQQAARNGGQAPATAAVTPARAYAPPAPAAASVAQSAAARARAAAPPRANGAPTAPVAAAWTGGKLQGLFLMTRFWTSSNSLELAVWYFAPDGKVYHNPESGFSDPELSRGKVDKGSFRLAGGKMNVAWADGKTTEGDFTPTATSFNWDASTFVPVKTFANSRALAGRYEGGSSMSGGGGSATSSSSLDLRADGTFSQGGGMSVNSTGATTKVTVGGQAQGLGRWTLNGSTLTLTDAQGNTRQGITFPYDDPNTAIYPDRFYFAGIMYKKQ